MVNGFRGEEDKMDVDQTGDRSPSISEQKQYWDDRWKKSRSPNEWSLRRGEKIISLIDWKNFQNPNILDIGCGTGWFTSKLGHFGTATGVDLSEESIAIAKDNYKNANFICGNLYELNLAQDHYDLIVAQEILPHVEDQGGFIKLLNDMLKVNGILVVSVMNKFIINRIERDHGPNSHIINWVSLAELRKLLFPNFIILKSTSVVTKSGKGILRITNSYKVKKALAILGLGKSYEAVKENMGLGLFRIILAKKVL